MIGLVYVWAFVAIAGILLILSVNFKNKLFGILLFLTWPISIPGFFVLKAWVEKNHKDWITNHKMSRK